MNSKHKQVLEKLWEIATNPNEYDLDEEENIRLKNILFEACEKADKFDLIQEKLTDRHLSMDEEVEEWNEFYIKEATAKEIIEMIDAMCVDEKADVIWQSGAYIRNKYIAQKIKERYGIKE